MRMIFTTNVPPTPPDTPPDAPTDPPAPPATPPPALVKFKKGDDVRQTTRHCDL